MRRKRQTGQHDRKRNIECEGTEKEGKEEGEEIRIWEEKGKRKRQKV